MTLYTEIDPYCCAVLRARVADGGLPPGDVWERDIRTLTAEELRPYRHVHLFCGIGGSPLGLRWAGWPEPYLDDNAKICYRVESEEDFHMAGKLKKLTPEKIEQAVKLYTDGLSCADVAAFFGITRQAMWPHLSKRTAMRPRERYGADNHFHRGGDRAVDRAQNLAEKAVEKGLLIPQPCETCGANGRMKDGRREVQAHHDDYTKPLEVRWLCQRCRHKWHAANKAKGRKGVKLESDWSIVTGGFP